LAGTETAWNQTWHLPTAPDPPTAKEFVEMVAREFGVRPRYGILTGWMTRLVGTFNTSVREVSEMLYQNEMEYVFDSTKFSKAFGFEPTSYPQGVRLTVGAYR
jgi:nucleoside-diphosphate-sugar epimerase